MNSPAFVFLFLFPILSASFRCCVCCLRCLQETCSTLLCENCRSCRTCRAAFRRACVSFISRKKYTDKYPDSIKLLQAGLSVIQTKTPGYPKKFQIFSQRRRMYRGGNTSPFYLHRCRKETGNIWLSQINRNTFFKFTICPAFRCLIFLFPSFLRSVHLPTRPMSSRKRAGIPAEIHRPRGDACLLQSDAESFPPEGIPDFRPGVPAGI